MARAKRISKGIRFPLDARGIAIVVLAVVSGICFALGFFVGRATVSIPPAEIISIEPAMRPQKEAATRLQTPSPAPIVTEREMPPISIKPAQTVKPAPASAPEPVVQTKPKLKPAPLKPEPSVPSSTKKTVTTGGLLSLQVGAFQNSKDASTIQQIFRKRGYTSFIIKTRNDKQKTIYKVKVGKFPNRESAERLKLKLKDEFGTDSFITSSN